MIQDLIDSAVILEELKCSDADQVLDEVLAAMAAAKCVAKGDGAAIGKKLAEREALGSTGIGNGVAVPHVKGDQITKISMALARSSSGIEYRAIDGRPVHIFFMILAPAESAEDHLQALRWISTLARNADFRRFALSAKTEADLRDLLREMSAPA